MKKTTKAKPQAKRTRATFLLNFVGIAPRRVTAAIKAAAEKAGRRMSASFAFATQLPR